MQLRNSFIPIILAAGLAGSAGQALAKVLRVCADPDYLPYSNSAGEGFENKIAVAVAKALGATVEYTSASYRGRGGFPQFLATTLDANKCDVVMNIPYGSRGELTTRPYYTSSYVFVFKKSKKFNVTRMDSPILKKIKVGFERDTPVEDGMKMRGMIPGAVAFDVGDDSSESPAPSQQLRTYIGIGTVNGGTSIWVIFHCLFPRAPGQRHSLRLFSSSSNTG